MENKDLHEELASIRNMMERSSKFISLSGLSGVLAGIYALVGASFAYSLLYSGAVKLTVDRYNYSAENNPILKLFIVAMLVLFLSLITGLALTISKAKRKGQSIWGKTSKDLLFSMAVPLFSGGLFILILLLRGDLAIVAPASLIFYGLALIGASNFTFADVKFLGISEIVLGFVSACLPGYGLLFWAIGFGVLHIIYGSVMYLKYDR